MKKQWQDKSKKEALRSGYIILEDVNNSKCFIKEYQEYLELDRMTKTNGFWEEYNQIKKELGIRFKESSEREKVSRYFELKGSIERSAMNWPIQGTAAAIVKRAMVMVRETFIEYNIYDKAKLINQVHDELVVECPGDIKYTAAEIVKRCMIEAGKIFCKKVPMVVEPSIETYWKK